MAWASCLIEPIIDILWMTMKEEAGDHAAVLTNAALPPSLRESAFHQSLAAGRLAQCFAAVKKVAYISKANIKSSGRHDLNPRQPSNIIRDLFQLLGRAN
jgi:hypothetical protein